MATETRITRTLRFNPERGQEATETPRLFRLEVKAQGQRRTASTRDWRDDGAPVVGIIADGITRRELAELISDGADWLSYIPGPLDS